MSAVPYIFVGLSVAVAVGAVYLAKKQLKKPTATTPVAPTTPVVPVTPDPKPPVDPVPAPPTPPAPPVDDHLAENDANYAYWVDGFGPKNGCPKWVVDRWFKEHPQQ